jgi:hypothetical protein
VPDRKDPTVEPVELPPCHPATDGVLSDPNLHQLRERDHPMLTLSNSRDRFVYWGAFFPHGRE